MKVELHSNKWWELWVETLMESMVVVSSSKEKVNLPSLCLIKVGFLLKELTSMNSFTVRTSHLTRAGVRYKALINSSLTDSPQHMENNNTKNVNLGLVKFTTSMLFHISILTSCQKMTLERKLRRNLGISSVLGRLISIWCRNCCLRC